VHLTLFPKPEELAPTVSKSFELDWVQLLALRDTVLSQLEMFRANKHIGKSLEAEVVFTADPSPINTEAAHHSSEPSFAFLQRYQETLPELLNVSRVSIEAGDNWVIETSVKKASGTKCDRCWRYTDDVGQNSAYPSVCLRCAEALDAIDFPPYSASTSTKN
jgi:isoleucyl-tRNA synthetase